ALEQKQRLIGSARGSQADDRGGSILLGNALEVAVGRQYSLLPRNRRLEPVPAFGQRSGHSLALLKLAEAQPALIAHPALVDLDVSPRDHPEYCPIAVIDPDVTAGRASAADGIGAQQKPDSALESEIPRGQSAHRADIDDIPGVWICERLIVDRAYFDMIAAPKELDLTSTGNIDEKANASRTQDAAL